MISNKAGKEMPSDSLNNYVCGFGYDLEELSENSILKMRKQI